MDTIVIGQKYFHHSISARCLLQAGWQEAPLLVVGLEVNPCKRPSGLRAGWLQEAGQSWLRVCSCKPVLRVCPREHRALAGDRQETGQGSLSSPRGLQAGRDASVQQNMSLPEPLLPALFLTGALRVGLSRTSGQGSRFLNQVQPPGGRQRREACKIVNGLL